MSPLDQPGLAAVPKFSDTRLLRQQDYIDGAWTDAISSQATNVINSATAAVIGTVPNMGAVEKRQAIDAANRASSQ